MRERIAIYYRVSTKGQDFGSQKNDVERFISELKEPPISVEVFCDKASGKSRKNRPEFQLMLDKCRNGEIDTIICYKLDRFSRDATTAIRLLLDLDRKGVAFISVTQPVLNLGHENPFRRTMLSAFAEIAELERRSIVERIKAGLEVARKKGHKSGPKFKYDRRVICDLHMRGLTYKEIRRETGASLGTISNAIKQEQLEDGIER